MKEPEYIKRDSSGACLTICRDGIEQQWLKLVNEDGLSYRKAAQAILESIEHVAGEPGAPELPTEGAIIDLGRAKKPAVGNSHKVRFPSADELEKIDLVREFTEGCSAKCKDPGGCRERLMGKSVESLKHDLDLINMFNDEMMRRCISGYAYSTADPADFYDCYTPQIEWGAYAKITRQRAGVDHS